MRLPDIRCVGITDPEEMPMRFTPDVAAGFASKIVEIPICCDRSGNPLCHRSTPTSGRPNTRLPRCDQGIEGSLNEEL